MEVTEAQGPEDMMQGGIDNIKILMVSFVAINHFFGHEISHFLVAGMNPQTGLPDYSLQWIEYYRSIGRDQEADAIERQRVSVKKKINWKVCTHEDFQGAAAAPAPMPHQPAVSATNGAAMNGATDYSLQWAEYYRKMGKFKEADAVEAGIKQKVRGNSKRHEKY